MYAIVDKDGNVVNIIVWDGQGDYNPGEGMTAIETDKAGLGWTYTDGVFSPPQTPADQPTE